MARAASLWNSGRSYILVNGSSGGILAGIRALTHRGDTVLLSRNAHKSVYHALELCGLRPVFLTPPFDPERGMFLSLPPCSVEKALAETPGIRLVILTSPTYEGVVSDVRSIAQIAHNAGAALLVDEAHGAHLSLHPFFPEGAVACGADVVVQSLHKTLPALTQTAILHTAEGVDEERIRHELAVFQTSSPSYLLMSSADGCIRTLSEDPCVMEQWAQRLQTFDGELGTLSRLRVPFHGAERGREIPGVFAADPSKICVVGADGEQLAAFFRRYGIEPEMTAEKSVLLMTGAGDTPAMMQRLAEAIREADAFLEPAGPTEVSLPELQGCGALSPEGALESPWELVSASAAVGRVRAEYIWAYPPGIPLWIPGERILCDVSLVPVQLHATRGDPPRQIAVLRESR
jgi:arginine/lysine/ornithine decarboxylase